MIVYELKHWNSISIRADILLFTTTPGSDVATRGFFLAGEAVRP
jgi:hypothetical protein